jgi:membrane protease YdiL (CAAX protease family)
MPEDLRHRAATVSRYASFFGSALILALAVVLMARSSVDPARVGIRLTKWKTNVAVGVAAGMALIVLQAFLVDSRPRGSGSFADRVRKGSIQFWVLIFLVGAFSEELWIALCLVVLMSTGHSTPAAVVITAIVFAAVHWGYGLGGAFAVAL